MYLNILCLASLILFTSCGVLRTACEELNEEDCTSQSSCLAVKARPFSAEENCFTDLAFAGCVDSQSSPCNNGAIVTFEDEEGKCCYQSGQCAPEAWFEKKSNSCGTAKNDGLSELEFDSFAGIITKRKTG